LRYGVIALILALFLVSPLEADEKTWSASGDGSTWSDEDNWSPADIPTSADDVLIDAEDASVVCTSTYNARSISIGGRETSNLISNSYIFGTISPDSGSNIAIENRSGGTFTLKGGGTVTLQGQYKDSTEGLVAEPGFMFWIE